MRPAAAAALLLTGPAIIGAAPAGFDLEVTVTHLRSTRGQVLACMTMRPAAFPGCGDDPRAIRRVVPAARTMRIDFGVVPAGRYAIALVHDENGNGRMDTRMMMPREGFGFSRDAALRLGPPSFDSAAFTLDATTQHQAIRMRYMF